MAAHPSTPTVVDLLAGSALGLFAGDALGAPVEGLPHHVLRQAGWVDEMHPGRGTPGTYTDDTQLMIGLLEALAADDTLPDGLLARTYADNFEPFRGYGASTGAALRGLRAGRLPASALSRDSYGNGGAMGIAPLGVYFHADLALVAERAFQACTTTHHHPEAVGSAIAVACAAALHAREALVGEARDCADRLSTLRGLRALQDPVIAEALAPLADLPASAPATERTAWLAAHYRCSLRAVESTPVAIGAALAATSLREAVEVAVNAGGDTDTQGAMAGGIAGARFGADALPRTWYEALENSTKGRDHVVALVQRLAAQHPRRANPSDG